MVFEFPELQGPMGGIYAREEGQPEQSGRRSTHQYLPVGVEADAPPSREQLGAAAVTWAAVSLADKLTRSCRLIQLARRSQVRAIRSRCGGTPRADAGAGRSAGPDWDQDRIAAARRWWRTALEVYGRPAPRPANIRHFSYERLLSVMLERGAPVEVVRAVVSPADAERR